MTKNLFKAVFLSICLFFAGCVTPHGLKADRNKYLAFNCKELSKEISVVAGYHNEAVAGQGLSSGNATAGVLGVLSFGLTANISNELAKSAEREAEAQKKFLYGIYDEKDCADELYQRGKVTQKSIPQAISQNPESTDPSQ